MKKININFIIGLFVLLAGVLLCVQVLNINILVDFSIIWWSFFTMVGVVIMINDRRVSIFPSLIMLIGIWYILKDLGIVTKSIFALIWPLILVVVGLNLMFSRNFFTKSRATKENKDGILTYSGVFGGVNERPQTKDFKGATVNALFGAVDLDLREIEITEKEVYLDISAIFGGVTILMPLNKYNIVEGDSLALLGGTENKCKTDYVADRPTIYINAKSILGGTEIK